MVEKVTIPSLVPSLISRVERNSGKIGQDDDRTISEYLSFLKSEIAEVNKSFNVVEMLEAVNAESEKEKWLRSAQIGNFENPSFKYDERKLRKVASRAEVVDELYDLICSYAPCSIREEFEIKMMHTILWDMHLTVKIAKSILLKDDAETRQLVFEKFGEEIPDSPSEIRFKGEASGIELREKTFDAEKIRYAFSIAQLEYGFRWPIVISRNAVAIDVRDKSSNGKQIIIPESRVVSSSQLVKLIGHEIESHQRTSMNGQELFGFGGLSMKTDDETLYEGIAMLSDRDYDIWEGGSYQNESAKYYVIAVKMAMQGESFSEIAKTLFQMRHHERNALTKAYNMTRRVLRGATKTENPAGYAFTKDLAYYRGLNFAIELEKQGFGWLLELGSFDLKQLELVARYFKLSPEMIPNKRIDLKNNQEFLKDLGVI